MEELQAVTRAQGAGVCFSGPAPPDSKNFTGKTLSHGPKAEEHCGKTFNCFAVSVISRSLAVSLIICRSCYARLKVLVRRLAPLPIVCADYFRRIAATDVKGLLGPSGSFAHASLHAPCWKCPIRGGQVVGMETPISELADDDRLDFSKGK